MRKFLAILGISAFGIYLLKRGLSPGEPEPPPADHGDIVSDILIFLGSIPYRLNSKERRILSYLLPIDRAAKTFSLEPALIAAIIDRESEGYPYVRGPVGEYGLMQVRDTTAQMMYEQKYYRGDYENLLDPETNINFGAAYLRWQMDRYADKPVKVYWAISAYNAGTAVIRDGEFSNQKYVDQVIERLERYAYLFNKIYRRYGALL
jgi:soluble lytic murein transglycosylase-like protein